MHELAIADAILALAAQRAGGRRVVKIEVTVGRLRQVVPSALAFAFQLAAEGTVAEGAELVLTHVPARVYCAACNDEGRVDEFPLACPFCGSLDVDLVAGDELRVEAFELEQEPTAEVGR